MIEFKLCPVSRFSRSDDVFISTLYEEIHYWFALLLVTVTMVNLMMALWTQGSEDPSWVFAELAFLIPEAPCKFPKEGGSQQPYPAEAHMNHNNGQHSMITMNLKENKGQGGTWESWIKEREGVNDVIIISKNYFFLKNEAVIYL